MANDIPPVIKEQFRESLSFVVALDLLIDRAGDLDQPAIEDVEVALSEHRIGLTTISTTGDR